MEQIDEIQQRIIRQFTELDDPLDEYELLLRMSAAYKGLPKGQQHDSLLVQGCQSRVWLHCFTEQERFFFSAESDTLIVRGILSLLETVLCNQPCSQVAQAKLFFLQDAGVMATFNASRRQGISAVVKKMQQFAASAVATEAKKQ